MFEELEVSASSHKHSRRLEQSESAIATLPKSNEVTVLYAAFGLLLRSNLRIPGLTPEREFTKTADVDLHLGFAPAARDGVRDEPEELVYASSYMTDLGEPALRIWKTSHGAFLRLDYFDGTQFWLDPAGTAVWAVWPATLSIEDVATYVLGPVLGLLLRLRGVPCLHASAVAFGNFTVALAGSEGAGKSTTAAALASRGHAVISDDIVALVEREGLFCVFPAYPYLSLWQESVNILYGQDKTLPSFSPSYDKRQLLLAENRLRFQETQLPLGAVFLLDKRVTDAAAPFVEKLPAGEALVALVANSYATNMLDRDMRAREFKLLGRLVTSVPIWRLRPHEEGSRIGGLCDLIQEKCHELGLTHQH
jgi:hypothetical protein